MKAGVQVFCDLGGVEDAFPFVIHCLMPPKETASRQDLVKES